MYRPTHQKIRFSKSTIHEDTYLNSPLYYYLTGRRGAWMYSDKRGSVVVCQHPHLMNRLMVFPEVGERQYTLTAKVLQYLYKSNHEIQLARYTDKDLERLDTALSTQDHNLVKNINIIDEDYMDWKYPVHIYNVSDIAALEWPEFRKVRKKFNRINPTLTHRKFQKDTALKDMRTALKYWEGSMINAEKDSDDMSDFYHEFFQVLSIYEGHYDGLLFFQGKRPVGFSVWDIVTKDTANSFINLGDASLMGLADYQRVIMCRHLYEQGITYLNVGGSETETLDAFKRKFSPCKSIQLHSAKVEYTDFIPDKTIRCTKFV